MSERHRGRVRAPELAAGLEWLNTERPLTLAALRGKYVLLDFWTYCCINCLHTLPELRKLELRFPEELAVIGVHSAKFPQEGNTFNLRQAVMRLDIRHPVVNDPRFLLWRAYAVKAWPTIAIIDPEGYLIGVSSGELDAEKLGDGLQQMIQAWEAKAPLDRTPIPLKLERSKQPDMVLSFPGKVLADPENGRLFVADTEHHRILWVGLNDGRIRAVFGKGEPGFRDGPADGAQFRSPQGMALYRDALFVADTENHAVRRISLETGVVTTFSGVGEMAEGPLEEGHGRYARLNSPWDVCVTGGTLLVAMAGSHQIWGLDLRSGGLFLFAGDGREALKDAPRREARLAQPSGLASDGEWLWFADSETSSLRSVSLTGDAPVRTHAGEGLFDFGDKDGDRKHARLQHPLGVACAGGFVYVADSYNNKIRVLDPESGMLTTLSGTGEPGYHDGRPAEVSFWEPGGLSAAGDHLYVADTNNHAIRIVHRMSGVTETLEIEG
jgi:thiol-disulfide isomerase/thioredoxin